MRPLLALLFRAPPPLAVVPWNLPEKYGVPRVEGLEFLRMEKAVEPLYKPVFMEGWTSETAWEPSSLRSSWVESTVVAEEKGQGQG